MKNPLPVIACLFLVLGVGACEQPKSPDFQLNHELEVPLSVEKTYPFLGESEALIDSTSEDFIDLFSSDGDGLVRLTKKEDFDFGNLEDAVPDIDAVSTTFNAEVGEIGLTNFSSDGSNVGSAGFESITGFSSPQQGQIIPAGSGTVNIPFSTDYFESAVIKYDGSLEVVLTNNLGFDIDELEISLNSGTNFVGSNTIGTSGDPNDNFTHDTQDMTTISIPASTQLSELNADITVEWNEQEMQEEGNNLVVNDVIGQNLIASEVTAAVESQSFSTSGVLTLDQSSFEFRTADDFVEMKSGDLKIDIDNNIDLSIETLTMRFPDIIDASNNPLEINISGIPARSDGGNYLDTIDLSGYRITAQNGTVDYFLNGTTEDTQEGTGSETRTINETDDLDTVTDINNLVIGRAVGYIVPNNVLLTEDATNDDRENLDAFIDAEATVTAIDGLSDFSDRVSDLVFENPALNISYLTNIGVNTTIYAVIAGTTDKGEIKYLTGKDGSPYQVQSSEIPSALEVNGQPATTEQVIKFSIETAENPDPQQGEPGNNEFSSTNTTSSAFFSNLPTKIRFIGTAAVNEAQQPGEVVNPVIFDPGIGMDLPLNFSADSATFKDTVDADLGNLPGKGDDQKLKNARLTLNYTNALPLDLDLILIMLDENGEEVIRKENIIIDGAGVDNTGYVNQPAKNKTEISFSEQELTTLNRTRKMRLDMVINTPDKKAVKIRADDAVTLQIQINADISTTVN